MTPFPTSRRVGGRYRIVIRGDGVETHCVSGVFQEIVPERKLVYTWAWESTPERVSRVTVEFMPHGEGRQLLLTHERFADRDARDRHNQGWLGCLARFDRYLSK